MSSCSIRAEGRRALALAAALLAVAGSAPAAAAARRAPVRTLCVDKVTVRDSPQGFAIGHLFRPQRLKLMTAHATHGYVLIRARGGLVGWIRKGALCPAAHAPR